MQTKAAAVKTAVRETTVERHREAGFETTHGILHWERVSTPGIALCGARLRGAYFGRHEENTGRTVECVVCIELAGGRT